MFSCSRRNKPESKMTRMFCPVRHVTAPVGRQTTLFGRDRQVAAPGRSLLSPTAFCFPLQGHAVMKRLESVHHSFRKLCISISMKFLGGYSILNYWRFCKGPFTIVWLCSTVNLVPSISSALFQVIF